MEQINLCGWCQEKTSYLNGFDGRFVDSAEMLVNPGQLPARQGPSLHRREGGEMPQEK